MLQIRADNENIKRSIRIRPGTDIDVPRAYQGFDYEKLISNKNLEKIKCQ